MQEDFKKIEKSNEEALVDAKSLIESDYKYKIVKMLAKGGMAYVFHAIDTNCQRSVALKMMIEDNNKEDELVRRFIEEAQITSQLDHPSIVPIYEFSRAPNGQPFYVMKMIKGETLEKIINELRNGNTTYVKKYPLLRLVDIFIKVCDAIGFAASKNVVHRDLKPDNIMIGQYGEVFVMDWGISKVCNLMETKELMRSKLPTELDDSFIRTLSAYSEVNVSSTFHGQILGSPIYMAPEQTCLDYEIDPRADIYALGGILYALLTLQAPHPSTKLKEIFQDKIKGNIIPASKRVKSLSKKKDLNVPSSLESVVQKAMAVNPEKRYQKASHLKHDLENWINGYATDAEGASQVRLLKLLFIRHQRLGIVISLLLISIIVFIFQINTKLKIAQLDQEAALIQTDSRNLYTLKQKAQQRKLRNRLSMSKEIVPYIDDHIKYLVQEDQFERAILLSKKLIILEDNLENNIKLIKLYILATNFDKAHSEIERALQDYPNETQLLNLLNEIK
ncbi:serine/threonine-protein kinase [Lentisphaera marina]|uniref:serine/threonine-protein kinase n=1 Tax=Lentisphaera marina TaxID=1111041 RepID=UPI002366E90C|nr:serine/threonine-protein kinase [Lentisphaera marina]MDD7986111.1 serine/threonine-protein kinase [Lentisphaera marina]